MLTICGVLTEMYNGTLLTQDQITGKSNSNVFDECLKKKYIEKAGFTDLGIQRYRITPVGKMAFDNKTY